MDPRRARKIGMQISKELALATSTRSPTIGCIDSGLVVIQFGDLIVVANPRQQQPWVHLTSLLHENREYPSSSLCLDQGEIQIGNNSYEWYCVLREGYLH